MTLVCQVAIESEDEETAWVRWSLRAGADGEEIATGRVAYDLETVQFRWQGGRPPREHEFLIRHTIDRAIRERRRAAPSGNAETG